MLRYGHRWPGACSILPRSLELRLRMHTRFMSRGCWEASWPAVLQEALQLTLQPAADTVSSAMVPHPQRRAEQLLPQHRFRKRESFYFARIDNRSSIPPITQGQGACNAINVKGN